MINQIENAKKTGSSSNAKIRVRQEEKKGLCELFHKGPQKKLCLISCANYF